MLKIKGFAATPVIFIAVFLITVMLFIHFLDIDKLVAEGVGKEARLRKLQADALKNQTAATDELYFCMKYWAQGKTDEQSLASNIGNCVNRTVTVKNYTDDFTASYNYAYNSGTLIDAVLAKTITVQARAEFP